MIANNLSRMPTYDLTKKRDDSVVLVGMIGIDESKTETRLTNETRSRMAGESRIERTEFGT